MKLKDFYEWTFTKMFSLCQCDNNITHMHFKHPTKLIRSEASLWSIHLICDWTNTNKTNVKMVWLQDILWCSIADRFNYAYINIWSTGPSVLSPDLPMKGLDEESALCTANIWHPGNVCVVSTTEGMVNTVWVCAHAHMHTHTHTHTSNDDDDWCFTATFVHKVG